MKRKDNPVSEEFDYYEDFESALEKIEDEYIAFRSYSVNKKKEGEHAPSVVYPERIFAYEFYHQYRRIMDGRKKRNNYKGILLNGEQTKDGEEFNAIKKELKTFSPDLILHGSLSTKDKQLWICEIKTHHNPSPFKDLFKIGLYRDSNVVFNNYIFLYVCNCENQPKEVKKRMSSYIKRQIKNKKHTIDDLVKNTICFFYNNCEPKGKRVSAEWLCNILIDNGVVQATE